MIMDFFLDKVSSMYPVINMTCTRVKSVKFKITVYRDRYMFKVGKDIFYMRPAEVKTFLDILKKAIKSASLQKSERFEVEPTGATDKDGNVDEVFISVDEGKIGFYASGIDLLHNLTSIAIAGGAINE